MEIYQIHQSYENNYRNHQMLKELFPGEGRVLFHKNKNKIMALSSIELDEKFKGDIGIDHIGNAVNYIDNIKEKEVQFSIRLNGCKQVKGKALTLLKSDIEPWVDSKLSKCGIDVTSRFIKDEGIFLSLKNDQCIYHASLFVCGTLKIVDEDLFKNFAINGIGRGRAFGFGLLNVYQV
jgi:CRISPR system Cascade subunit CasE